MSMNGTKITNLANGTAATDAAAFGQIKLIQTVTFKTDTVTSTSSSSYQNTSLAVTITPTSASNRIKITVTGNLDNLVSTRQVLATIARGATNLGGVNGIATTFDTSGRIIVPCAMSIIDTPATTSATTYTVQVATPSGGAVSWGFVSCDQTIIAEEIV
jgi:3-polyprenyl-4-hydroxybenzoate decarboxylase